MIDRILLFPYTLTLALRNAWYRNGRHSVRADVPTICVGNLTAGGTGKTPLTERILRILLDSDEWAYRNLAVLSRGYRRKSRGFQIVPRDGTARLYGDEPLQMAQKFPSVTVAVDKDRVEGCSLLTRPEGPAADVIILDDAYQYRRLKADLDIVLTDYSRPVHKDKLLPFGRLRDLPARLADADMIVVSKCPTYLDEWEKGRWAAALGISGYSTSSCQGRSRTGKTQVLLFSTLAYSPLEPVFPEGDARYVYAQRAILCTGIANDRPLRSYLSDTHKVVKAFHFPDHHRYTNGDIRSINGASRSWPTALVVTTEKDARRILDVKKVPSGLKERLFQIPVETTFLTETEDAAFTATLLSALRKKQ